MPEFLVDTLSLCGSYFVTPDQRLHVGYLCSAALLAWWIHRRDGRSSSRTFVSLFDRRVWWSASAQVDYKIVVFNGFVKVLLLGQLLSFGFLLAAWTRNALEASLGAPSGVLQPDSAVVLYTIGMTVLGDLSVYVIHRLMHRLPVLWAFHSVHHSATTLSPITQLRLHPVELFLNNLRALLVFGLLTGTFDYLADSRVSKLTFLGANVFSFAFFVMGANLRHSHVRFPYPHALEHVFISPLQHQIHHSIAPEHHNRNFGSKFALWDWFFGTLVTSRKVGRLRFGLKRASSHPQTLLAALWRPFRPPTD